MHTQLRVPLLNLREREPKVMLFYLTKLFYVSRQDVYFKLLKLILSELLCERIVSERNVPVKHSGCDFYPLPCRGQNSALCLDGRSFCSSLGRSDTHISVRVPHAE